MNMLVCGDERGVTVNLRLGDDQPIKGIARPAFKGGRFGNGIKGKIAHDHSNFILQLLHERRCRAHESLNLMNELNLEPYDGRDSDIGSVDQTQRVA